jgi:uncharacterized protein (TIGR00661 family)
MQIIHRCELPAAIVDGHQVGFHLTKAFIKSKLPLCDAYYVTSFVRPPIRKPDTYLFPPILRPEILAATPRDGDHLLVYQPGANPALEAALIASGRPCRIYGMRPGATTEVVDGNLGFRCFSEAAFIDDLASCQGVVASAGFTLMGEAVYLHKPMLALPLAGQFEQILNARYLADAGFGIASDAVDDSTVITRFVAALPSYARNLASYQQDGNREILTAVDHFLTVAAEPR